MIVSLSISLLTSVSKPLLLSKQHFFPVTNQNNLKIIQFSIESHNFGIFLLRYLYIVTLGDFL